MNPQEEIVLLEGLLDELLSAVQQVLSSGETLSDQIQGMIAQEIELTLNRIDQLREENPVEGLQSPVQEPKLNQGMPSSNIDSFGYDDENQRLLVRFLGQYPNREGPIYSYDNVPKVIFDLFQSGSIPARTTGSNKWGAWWKGKVPSLGASLYTLIKNGPYSYQRIS